jgi:hypothetical protein
MLTLTLVLVDGCPSGLQPVNGQVSPLEPASTVGLPRKLAREANQQSMHMSVRLWHQSFTCISMGMCTVRYKLSCSRLVSSIQVCALFTRSTPRHRRKNLKFMYALSPTEIVKG